MNKHASSTLLLGITGAIAAYKIPDLVRRLREIGVDVRVMMSQNAQQFVTPITLQALCGHPVYTDLWDTRVHNAMRHIELARFADRILIAPTSANFIAKLAQGYADDLMTTVCLATQAQIYIAPSMNRLMWENAATQENIQLLKKRGIIVIPPACGEQACGEYGDGRMPEVEELMQALSYGTTPLSGKRILITAGPTIEAIDPVRFISNHSSGKMGYALAQAAKIMGAQVTLISGPVQLKPLPNMQTIFVKTAEQMYEAVMSQLSLHDIFIGAAAVADYRVDASDEKLKKNQEKLHLELIRTKDILAEVAKKSLMTVGFAAETTDILQHAQKKLLEKNIDMICVNDVSGEKGFYSDENEVMVLTKDKQVHLPRAHKNILAQQIMQHIVEYINEKRSA